MDNLAEDQKEKLRQFTEFTQVHDYNVAVGTLASLDWNLEQAIEAHLMQDNADIQDDPEIIEAFPQGNSNQTASSSGPEIIDIEDEDMPSARGRRRRVRNQEETVDNQIDDDERPEGNNEPTRRGSAIPRYGRRAPEASAMPIASSAPSSRRRGPSGSSVPLAPQRQQVSQPAHAENHGIHVYNIDSDDDDMNVIYDDDDDDHAPALEAQSVLRSTNGRVPMIPDGYTSVPDALRNFVSIFSARFCSTPSTQAFMPPFYTDSLPNALKEAFEQPNTELRRPLVFYINHDRSIASNIFASQVLCSEAVSSLIRHQYVLFPWDITSESNLVHFTEFLQAASIGDIRSLITRLAMSKVEAFPLMVILVRERNTYRLVDYCKGTDTCEQVVEKLCQGVEEYTTIRLNEANERRERQEREAIRSQQEAEYQASLVADRARIEAKQREIEEQRIEEEKKQRAEEEEAVRRQLVASTLPSEPAATETDVLNVKFRLPEGGQDMRRFRKDESIQTLIDYLSSKGFAPNKFKYFNSDFPKKEITKHFDLAKKFTEAKWPAREQVFVEEI
ncbi:unnamed protein product [Caenorhabditis sp. 36 PRJEB53466]|nr:unnamed protein product [Caenorhabditis sp. 36 PRJEB53466]